MNTMYERFKARAEAVSAEVHRFPTKPEALHFILQFLQKENIADAPQAYAAWAECPFLNGFDKRQLSAQLPGLKFEVTRQIAADAKVGISELDWGIANTGTLVQDATAVEKRLVSTLPIIHIGLVGANAIVPDLAALLTKIGPQQARYLSFITGPSRTADIERVLTIGVHGPERLIIVGVDELGGTH